MCKPHADGWQTIHGVPKGFLDVEVWKHIARGLNEDKIEFDHIIFQWLGDPSLHPNLPELIRIAVTQLGEQVNYLRIDTNAILLDRPVMDDLLRQSLQSPVPILMVFTIDAASSDVYQKLKGGDHYQRVLKNIRYLIRERRRLGSAARFNIQLQFVVQEQNAHQVKAFLVYWSNLISCQAGQWHDEIMFKRLSVDGGGEGQANADSIYHQAVLQEGITNGLHGRAHVSVWSDRPWQHDDKHQGPRTPCPGLWMTPVIRHDGRLMMCCADLKGELQLGSLLQATFLELWEGEHADAIRQSHMKGQFEGVCKHCGGINWYDLKASQKEQTTSRIRARQIDLD
jgi:MoaA/NifB/PqqE/SkfB family radical SAM enzyme